MKKILVALILLLSLITFSESYFVGVEITGHLFGVVGVSCEVFPNNEVSGSIGISLEAIEPTISYLYTTPFNVNFISNLKMIYAFDNSDKQLYLFGFGIGYKYQMKKSSINFKALSDFTMPFGATNTIKGPIPFLNIEYSF